MKKSKILFKVTVLFVFAIPLFFIGCQDDESPMKSTDSESLVNFKTEPIEGQYIVVLNGESSAKKANLKYSQMKNSVTNEILSKFPKLELAKENIVQTYGFSVNGFAAKLSVDQLEMLKSDSRVKYIEQDKLITLAKPAKPGSGGGGTVAQEIPWGITRVNGGVTGGSTGTAWVIDSGVDLTHPDLNVDASRSVSFLGGRDANNPSDANGHGTHVAGTIAAIDNSEGVVGVDEGATVVAVRVLDRRGSGAYSGVIAGVEYVGANGKLGDVANMSLGGGASDTLDAAVVEASNLSKVIFCLAAGNESDDANNHSPARANGNYIVTVSASDVNDNFASFSNYGNPPIDWCAPGVGIKSTWKDGGYNTISGTSMATPHVAGVLLLGNGAQSGFVSGDPDGNPDKIITH